MPIEATKPWFVQFLAFLFFSFLGISITYFKFNKAISIFSTVALWSTFFISKAHPRSLFCLFQIYLCMGLIYLLSRFTKKQRSMVLYSISVLIGILVIMHQPGVRFTLASGLSGVLFACTAPILAYLNIRLLIIPLAGIVLSTSLISGFAAAVAIAIFLKRKLFVVLIIISLVVAAPLIKKDLPTRLGVWKHSVKSVIEGKMDIVASQKKIEVVINPLTGYGFSNFFMLFPFVPQQENFNYFDEKMIHAHNDLVEFLFETSIAGVAAMLLCIFFFVISYLPKKEDKELTVYFCGILAFLINSLGYFAFHLALSRLFFVLLLGFYEGRKNELRQGGKYEQRRK